MEGDVVTGEFLALRERIATALLQRDYPGASIEDGDDESDLMLAQADAVLDALGLVPVARYEPTKWAVGPAGSPMEQKPLPYLTFLAWDDDPYADIDMPEGEVVYRLSALSGSD